MVYYYRVSCERRKTLDAFLAHLPKSWQIIQVDELPGIKLPWTVKLRYDGDAFQDNALYLRLQQIRRRLNRYPEELSIQRVEGVANMKNRYPPGTDFGRLFPEPEEEVDATVWCTVKVYSSSSHMLQKLSEELPSEHWDLLEIVRTGDIEWVGIFQGWTNVVVPEGADEQAIEAAREQLEDELREVMDDLEAEQWSPWDPDFIEWEVEYE